MKNEEPIKKRKLLFFISITIFLVFILIISVVLTTQYTENNVMASQYSNSLSNDNSKTELGNRYDPFNIAFSDNFQDGSCAECHDGFNPFDVELEMAGEAQPGSEFQYDIIVTNSDSELPHSVEELEAKLIGLGEEINEPYHNELSGTVRRVQANSHRFPIDENAAKITMSLSGDAGVLGRNDIDMTLTSPNGQSWSSSQGGVDEEIELDTEEISEAGAGEFTINIQYISGLGSISYSISIDVLYMSPEFQQFGSDLSQGDSFTFSWNLILTAEELKMMGSEVAGTVQYTHDGGNTESYRYIIEITPGLEVNRDDRSITNPLLGNGQIIGFLTLGILIVIIVNGFSKTSRKILAKPLKVKDPQSIHCYLSLVIILFGIFHGSLLISGPYSWNSEPNLFGASALTIFGIMAVTSFSRKRIIDRIGDKNWKRLHLVFTILVASILIYHVVTFGGHFS